MASMLREGIPLEGALKELSQGMKDGRLRAEIDLLQADLGAGIPLAEALGRRRLPEFYRKMVEIGARSNDLPGLLTLLADHYDRINGLWTRLKGLLVYPTIVAVASLCMTVLAAILIRRMAWSLASASLTGPPQCPPEALMLALWFPPATMALVTGFVAAGVLVPTLRARLRWMLPAFREASVAQVASALGLMLKNGLTLSEALWLAEELEGRTPARPALAHWRGLVEAGKGRPIQWGAAARPFPPLFLWLVQRAGEDPATGLQKAAEIYRARAGHRMDLALYGALPMSILLLGGMVLWQLGPLVLTIVNLMNSLGDASGGL